MKLYKKESIIGPIAKLTEAVFELLVPYIMSKLIDNGIMKNDIHYIIKTGLLLVLLGVSGLSCALVCQYFASKASQGVGTAIRNDLFRHILSLSAAETDKISSSSLITRLNSDVNQLQLAVAMLIRLAVRAPFLIIGSTVAAILIDVKLSVIFLITAPLLGFVLYEVMKHSVPFYKVIQKQLDKVSLLTKESLSGAIVIRAFSMQSREENRFAKTSDELSKQSMTVGRISSLLGPLTFLIMNTAVVFILWFGGKRVNTGNFTQGEIIAFVNYITSIMLTMVVLANIIVIFTKAGASAVRVNEIFEMKPSITEINTTPITTDKNAPAVEFRNVSFTYNTESEKVLENISFKISVGEKVGIIGGTGSGKTSILNLIPRYYDTLEGDVYVFGRNVKEFPFSQLRSSVITVEQKVALLSGTVRDNIRLSDKSISDGEIMSALETAQAADFVNNTDDKLDHYIEQNGQNLSGGQKQRLAVARAIAAKPEILILDDSSSALDFSTEAKMRAAISASLPKTTIITSTQRVSCVMHCDSIIVIDDGKVVAHGTHKDLYNNCDIYKEICNSQLKEKEEIK